MSTRTLPDHEFFVIREASRLGDLLAFVRRELVGPVPLVIGRRGPHGRCNAADEVHRTDCAVAGEIEPLAWIPSAPPQPSTPESAAAVPDGDRTTVVCSCVLGGLHDQQMFLDDLHELLAFDDALRRVGVFSNVLPPGSEALLVGRMRSRTEARPPHPRLRGRYAQLLQESAPAPAGTAGFAPFAARRVTYDHLAATLAARPRAEDRLSEALETWLLEPSLFDDPYRSLDDAFQSAPIRLEVAPPHISSMPALRLDWCGSLKLAHADLDPVVCEIVGEPGSDHVLRGAVAATGARIGEPFTAGARAFGVYPEVVASWLAAPSKFPFALDEPGPAVLNICGPLSCDPTPEDWVSALVLYGEDGGGFGSFADALTAATLL